MSTKTCIIFLFTLFIFGTACSHPEQLEPLKIEGFRLNSPDPAGLAKWYSDNLGIQGKQEKDEWTLSNSNTRLSITTSSADALLVASGKQYPGFFKIGFKTSQLDQLYEQLKDRGNQFRGDIFYDDNLQTRSLVALDVDGNRVQFFEDSTATDLLPCFFSIMTTNFTNTKAWVESEFGFEQIHQLDLPERNILIRLLKKDDVMLELISIEGLIDDGTELPGIESIVLNRSGTRNGTGQLLFGTL